MPTPVDYADFLRILGTIVEQLDKTSGAKPSIGMGAAGMIDRDKGTVFAPNIMCLPEPSVPRRLRKIIRTQGASRQRCGLCGAG